MQRDLRPVALTQPKPGVWVFDLGQNFSGWNRLRVQGPAGTTVTLRHAEVLNPDGTLYTTNLRAAQVTDQFVLAGTGQAETFEPRFTVHGYRYVELTGLPSAPTLDTITGRAAWTNGEEIGGFDTSDPMLDKLQNAIVWGQRSNMLYVPTDCPQRDERLGWTGDIASFAPTSTHNMDVSAFLDKFTDDMVDAQRSDGAFTDVAPNVGGMGGGTAAWGDAGVIVPFTLWQRYGDLRVVQDNFGAMTKWVDYLRSTAEADLIRDRGGFGDWLNVNDDTPRNVISTAYFAWSARLVSQMAQAIGKPAEAAAYGSLADQVSAAFTNRLVAADGTVSGNTQTGYSLALAFGLVPHEPGPVPGGQARGQDPCRLQPPHRRVRRGVAPPAGAGRPRPGRRRVPGADAAGLPRLGLHDEQGRHDRVGAVGQPSPGRVVPGSGDELLQPLRDGLGRRLPLPHRRWPEPGLARLPVAAHRPETGWRADLGQVVAPDAVRRGGQRVEHDRRALHPPRGRAHRDVGGRARAG